jgi:fumarate hydratase subunit alpha
MITEEIIEDTICQLYKKAVIDVRDDVKTALEEALKIEDNDLGKLNISNILKNVELASKNHVPMCQDTGLPIIFVKIGKVECENLNEAIKKGVIKATKETPLRPNVVDPLTRENTSINVGDEIPQINIEFIDEPYLELTVLPKGFGSENNNKLKMALPAEGIQGIKDFVIESALVAGGKPCPPMIVGVGVGGTSDMALKLGKKALLNPIGERNPNKDIAELETEILNEINKNGKGPMGMGGKTTALDVKIMTASTHTAGLPIGVVIQCWAHRHATTRLFDN